MFLWTEKVHFAAHRSHRPYTFSGYGVNGTLVPIRVSGATARIASETDSLGTPGSQSG
jgi:hypothetical protein